METNQFELFRLRNLEKIRGGSTIYCKDINGVNLGTVEYDCGSHGGGALNACTAAYSNATQSAGPC